MRRLGAILAITSSLVAVTVAAQSRAATLMTWPDLLSRPAPQPDRRIAYGPQPGQVAELWLPSTPGRHHVVILVHGGCWRAKVAGLSIMNFVAGDLRDRGLAVWNIEYRGVDQDGGGYPGTFLDVARAADALRSEARAYRLDLRRVVAVGHSAGGHLAAWLAARRRIVGGPLAWSDPLPIAGVVSLGGLPDLKADRAATGAACGLQVIDALTGAPGPAHPDVFADTSPAERLPLGTPQTIVNGADDTLAPPWLGEAYAARARAAGDRVTVVVIPDTGHVELIAPGTAAWSREAALITGMVR